MFPFGEKLERSRRYTERALDLKKKIKDKLEGLPSELHEEEKEDIKTKIIEYLFEEFDWKTEEIDLDDITGYIKDRILKQSIKRKDGEGKEDTKVNDDLRNRTLNFLIAQQEGQGKSIVKDIVDELKNLEKYEPSEKIIEYYDLSQEWERANGVKDQTKRLEDISEVRQRAEAFVYILLLAKGDEEQKGLKDDLGEEVKKIEKSFNVVCTRFCEGINALREDGSIKKHNPDELVSELLTSLKLSLATDQGVHLPLEALGEVPGLKKLIKESPKEWGAKIENDNKNTLIELQTDHIMTAVKGFIEAQLKRVEDNKTEDKLLEKEQGLLDKIMQGVDWETPLGRENRFTLDMISNLLKNLSQLEQSERMDADKREQIHKVVVDNLEKIQKIRQSEDSPEEKDKKISEILKNISKTLWGGSKNLVGILGSGLLLWGAAFAFYLPLLIIKHAEEKVKPFGK